MFDEGERAGVRKWHIASGRGGLANALNLLPLRRNNGHGGTCCRFDPVAMTLLGHGRLARPGTITIGVPGKDWRDFEISIRFHLDGIGK